MPDSLPKNLSQQQLQDQINAAKKAQENAQNMGMQAVQNLPPGAATGAIESAAAQQQKAMQQLQNQVESAKKVQQLQENLGKGVLQNVPPGGGGGGGDIAGQGAGGAQGRDMWPAAREKAYAQDTPNAAIGGPSGVEQGSQSPGPERAGGQGGAGAQGQAPAGGTQVTQKHRLMGIGTPLGEDTLLLRSFTFTEGLSRLFNLQADLLSDNHNIAFDDIVGRNVTVRLETTKDTTRYFNGIVSSFAQRRRTGRYANYQATIVPWLWLLTRTSDCRIFQEKKVPDIIKEIFRDHGMTDFDDRLTKTYREWEYCVQYRETDFNFVSRLMEQEGIYYYFEHENGKHKLILCDAPSTHEPYPSYESISYRPADHATTDREHVRDWRVEKNVEPGAFVTDDFDFKNPRKELEVNAEISRQHMAADFQMYDYPGEYVEYSDGEKYARVRIEEMHARHELVRGDGDVRGISAGYKFSLEDYPREDQCREYLVVGAAITAENDSYESGRMARGGSLCACSFTGIPADQPFRAPRSTPKPLIQGPQTAIVVGPSGEEIYTDPHGRVKVQFHWDRRSKGNETSSCWIRVAQLWAGKKWGAMFIPRIGQEVIVEFLEADPDRPIVTGRVYNGEEMPPYELPTHKTRSTVKSNSSKGGAGYNEIRIEDKKGSEQVYIHAEKDEDVRVENDSKEWIGKDRHLIVTENQYEKVIKSKHLHVVEDQLEQVDGDRHVHVKTDDMLKVGGSLSLTVGADHDAKVTNGYTVKAMTIHLKAETQIIIEAPIIDIKASGPCAIEAGATLTLKGATVLINSGGGAATATDAQPEAPTAPTDPLEADTAVAGEVDQGVKAASVTPATYSDAAKVMKQAAEDGTPFCEECARARREAEEAKKGGEPEGDDGGKKGKGAEGPTQDDWDKKDNAPAQDDYWGKKGKGAEGGTSGGGGAEGGQTSGGEKGGAGDEEWGKKAPGGGGGGSTGGGEGGTTVGTGSEGADEGEEVTQPGTQDMKGWGGSANAGMGDAKGSANVGD